MREAGKQNKKKTGRKEDPNKDAHKVRRGGMRKERRKERKKGRKKGRKEDTETAPSVLGCRVVARPGLSAVAAAANERSSAVAVFVAPLPLP